MFANAKLSGTLKGSGFDCRTGKMHSQEGKKEGYWNKVHICKVKAENLQIQKV